MKKDINAFILVLLFLFFYLTSCSNFLISDSIDKKDKDSLVKQQTEELGYIDTTRSDIKAIEHIVNASVCKINSNYAMAILEYNQALKYDTTAAILYAIAECYYTLKNYDLMKEYALSAVKKEPDFLPAYSILAKAYLESLDAKNAIIVLEDATKVQEVEEMLFYLANVYDTQNIEKSKEHYLKFVEKYNNDAALVRLIAIYKNNVDTAQYINTLTKLWKKIPNNYIVASELINAWCATKNYDEFFGHIDIFDANFTLDELTDIYNFAFSQIFFVEEINNMSDSKDKEDSENLHKFFIHSKHKQKLLEKIDDRFSSDDKVNINAGQLSLLIADTLSAAKFFSKIITYDGDKVDINIHCALAYYNYKYVENAKQILHNLSISDKKNWKYTYWIGRIEWHEKNYENAIRMFKESYILDSMQIEVWESLADVYSVVENYDQSDFFYEKILLKSPNNLTACNNYAYYLSNRNKDLDKALILAQRALDGNSESSEYLDTYGWIKFKLGDYQVALEFVEKSLQYNDTHSEVYGHLADIYLMLGNIVEAKKALDKALVIDPDNIKLLEKRKLLETK